MKGVCWGVGGKGRNGKVENRPFKKEIRLNPSHIISFRAWRSSKVGPKEQGGVGSKGGFKHQEGRDVGRVRGSSKEVGIG